MASGSSTSLEVLPLHLLESICEYVAYCDSKRRSLFDFSLTSKYCCCATTPQRFARIIFTMRGNRKLRQDLARWNEILRVDGRFGHVRSVKVVGRLLTEQQEQQERYILFGIVAGDDKTSNSDDKASNSDDKESNSDSDSDDEQDFCEFPQTPYWFNGSRPRPKNQEQKDALDQPWIPLAHFISRLSGLKDLVWACENQLPPCLLSTIHEHHPRSRLHIHTFSLRSLYQNKDHLHDIDPDEFAIASSPCLTSLAVSHNPFDNDGNFNYNEEAVHRMIEGLAPNLASVCMWAVHPGGSLGPWETYETPRPPWLGCFTQGPRDEVSKGHLQQLMLGSDRLNCQDIVAWSHRTNLDELRSLKLITRISLEAIETLTVLAREGQFKSLRQLLLVLTADDHEQRIQLDGATSLFLEALAPLEDIYLTGFWGHATFNAILNHHGSSLRKIRLEQSPIQRMQKDSFIVSRHRVEEIAQACPNLANVELFIPRTQGDEHEVAIYRALGRMKKLKRVSLFVNNLKLSVSNFGLPIISPGPDQDATTEDIRKVFINAAIDSSLAISIFRIISADNPRFERLTLKFLGANSYGFGNMNSVLMDILQWIGRNWVCKKNRGEIIAKELEKNKRIEEGGNMELYIEDRRYEEVWRSIWPEKTGDWRKDWSSLPLSE